MKEKNFSIELLKFIAVIIVMNSHMDVLYGKYDFLATGGAIGDALFFFISGFTIFLGRFGRFDNWYKRRIKRIYPSLIAWVAILSFLNVREFSMDKVIRGGYWFISCIMLYYVVLWGVRRFAERKPLIPFVLCCLGIVIWYCIDANCTNAMYGNNYFKWLFFFLFMLAGAYAGNGTFQMTSKSWFDGTMLVLSVIIFYGIQFIANKYSALGWLNMMSLVPLMGVALFGYKLCCAEGAVRMMNTKWGWYISSISGLCLEVYIIQVTIIPLLPSRTSELFPFNVLIIILVVFIASYLTRSLGRVFSQIFEKDDMNWKKVFELVE